MQRARARPLAAALLSIGLAWAGHATAQEPDTHDFGLSGDWGGVRSRLKDAGWTFDIQETVEAAANQSGGDARTSAAAGQFTLGATLDMDKFAGIQGGQLKMTITRRDGNSLSDAAGLQALQPLLAIHGRGNIWRLTQLFWEQDLAAGRAALKLGRVNPGADFAAFACDFQNLTFCGAQPGNLVGSYWQNSPVSQWGGRLKLHLNDGTAYLSAGAYRISQENVDDGFALAFDGQGVLYPVELGWSPKLGAAQRPGEYKLTAWYSTVEAEDVRTGATRQGRYGASALLKQQVTGRPDGPGLTLFLRLTQADQRTSRLDRQLTAGANWRGPLASRPNDVLALAVGVTHVNDRVRADAAGAQLEREYVAELDYRLKLRKSLTLMPNIQYVHRTGGRDLGDIIAGGLKVAMAF